MAALSVLEPTSEPRFEAYQGRLWTSAAAVDNQGLRAPN